MTVSARDEFRIWAACGVIFFVVTVALVAFAVGEGGMSNLVPTVWFVGGLAIAAWVRKRRNDAVIAYSVGPRV